MKSKSLVFWLALLLLFAGGSIVYFVVRGVGQRQVSSGAEENVDFGPPLEDFQLMQSTGEKFDSKSLDGEVWIGNFFYSSCPSICVQQNLRVQELQQEFGHRGVKFVSITCDAPTDTPRRLTEYSQRFNAQPESWTFLTGDQQYIERVGKDIFKLPVQHRGHSERLVVIDRQGKIRGAFHFKNAEEMQQLRELVNTLLAEKPADEQEKSDRQPAGTAEEESAVSVDSTL